MTDSTIYTLNLLKSIIAGTNISVDNTDAHNPIVALNIPVQATAPSNPVVNQLWIDIGTVGQSSAELLSALTLAFEKPVGDIDDENVVFETPFAPLFIIVNGAVFIEGEGQFKSWINGILTLNYPVGLDGTLTSVYYPPPQ